MNVYVLISDKKETDGSALRLHRGVFSSVEKAKLNAEQVYGVSLDKWREPFEQFTAVNKGYVWSIFSQTVDAPPNS